MESSLGDTFGGIFQYLFKDVSEEKSDKLICSFISGFKSLVREELVSKNTDELFQKMNTLKDQLNDQYKLSVDKANQLIEDCDDIRAGVYINPVLYHTAVILDPSEDIDKLCIKKSMGLYYEKNIINIDKKIKEYTLVVSALKSVIYTEGELISEENFSKFKEDIISSLQFGLNKRHRKKMGGEYNFNELQRDRWLYVCNEFDILYPKIESAILFMVGLKTDHMPRTFIGYIEYIKKNIKPHYQVLNKFNHRSKYKSIIGDEWDNNYLDICKLLNTFKEINRLQDYNSKNNIGNLKNILSSEFNTLLLSFE